MQVSSLYQTTIETYNAGASLCDYSHYFQRYWFSDGYGDIILI